MKEKVLKDVFGLDSFRGIQSQVVDSVLEGKDTLVLMPTGFGKSLCYQLPAMLLPGLTVVVSPLLALMKDQVDKLRIKGVQARMLGSTLDAQQNDLVIKEILSGELKLLYISPERVLTGSMIGLLKQVQVSLIAIDEAHCVSVWGHDFRPRYSQLSKLKEVFPSAAKMALTATADMRTRDEIISKLLINPVCYVGDIDRPNINHIVVRKTSINDQLVEFIKTRHREDVGIVYVSSRERTESIAQHLRQSGLKAFAYHAGMVPEERECIQNRFKKEDRIIVVATVAFGMGIDRRDVRFVAHADIPKSIENYIQEIGRAGRDGLPADAWMAYNYSDIYRLNFMIDRSEGEAWFKNLSKVKLQQMLDYAETAECRRGYLLKFFGQNFTEPCGKCDNCLNKRHTWDATVAVKKFLSCVYRVQAQSKLRLTDEQVIDVLLANASSDDENFDLLEKLSTWGIGIDLSKKKWRQVARYCLTRGLIEVDLNFNCLCFNQRSLEYLRSDQKVLLTEN